MLCTLKQGNGGNSNMLATITPQTMTNVIIVTLPDLIHIVVIERIKLFGYIQLFYLAKL